MSKYTAEDFANAAFAELPKYGIRAHKSAGDSFWQRDGIKRATDEEMADAGWVPVPDKPTIAAGAAGRHSYLLGPSVETPRVIDYLEALGIKVIPDPEPTNAEKLEAHLTMTEEFVVFNAAGAEIDSIDPYMEHATDGEGVLWVSNFVYTHRLEIPEGGWWEIREMSNHD